MPFDLKTAGAGVGLTFTLIGGLYSGGSWVESRYAHQDAVSDAFVDLHADVDLVNLRIDQGMLFNRQMQVQERMWKIEDRYGKNPDDWPEIVKEEYRHLQAELAEIKRKMGRMEEWYQERQAEQSKH